MCDIYVKCGLNDLTTTFAMHTTPRFRLLVITILLLLQACEKGYDSPTSHGEELIVTATLPDLRTYYAGRPTRIEKEVIVSGRVTSSDRAGNFYRSLTIESHDAAAELMVGLDHLHNDYPIGTKLYVRLQGLTVGEQRGVLQIGHEADPASGFAVDYLPSKAAVDQHIVRSSDPIAEPIPLDCTIAQLSPEMAGRLVRIEKLTYLSAEEPQPATWRGEHLFSDHDGHCIETFVRHYADFADRLIPAQLTALTGILQCTIAQDGSFRYQIKPRDEADLVP